MGKGKRAVEGGGIEGWGRLGEGTREEESWVSTFP